METTSNNNIESQISSLADMQKALTENVMKLANFVTNTLAGPQQTTSAPQQEARRRGRPLGSKNKPKAGAVETSTVARAASAEVDPPKPLAVPDAPPASKPLHPTSIEMMHRVMKEGKVRYADLAKGSKIHRSLVNHYMDQLIDKGKVKVMVYRMNGRRNFVAYRPDWILTHD